MVKNGKHTKECFDTFYTPKVTEYGKRYAHPPHFLEKKKGITMIRI